MILRPITTGRKKIGNEVRILAKPETMRVAKGQARE